MTLRDTHDLGSDAGVWPASGAAGSARFAGGSLRASTGAAASCRTAAAPIAARSSLIFAQALPRKAAPGAGSRFRCRLVFGLACLALGQLLGPPTARAQPVALTEYAAKAALLFNIAKYAEWPGSTFLNSDSPIVIGILGVDPFGEVLDRVVRGRKINGRSIAIRRAGGVEALRGAHLVFVSATESHSAHDWAILESFNVLTVGDTAQTALFTAFHFTFEGDRIAFSVDLGRAARAGVTISSKLLNLARAVKRADEDKAQ